MTTKRIMNWVWDHPLTTTIVLSIPTFMVVIWILLKTHLI